MLSEDKKYIVYLEGPGGPSIWRKIWNKLKVYFRPFLNWKFALCFGLGWMITNGWAWIGLGILPWIGPNWYSDIAAAYMAFLWLPFTPEKLITLPIAIGFHKLFFRKDPKTRKQLNDLYAEAKLDWKHTKEWFKKKFKKKK